MTQKDLDRFEELLLQARQELLESILEESEDEENPFVIDGDLADRAEIYSEVAINENLSAGQKETLDEINRALHRIKEKSYGHCRVCKKEIEHERLEAIPWATTCIEHMNED